MKVKCPRNYCPHCKKSPEFGLGVSAGRYFRKSDSRYLARFRCLNCRRSFSKATVHPCYGQKKRRVNVPLYRLLCSGVSQRRAAKLLRIHRTTVARKLRFLADQCRLSQKAFLKTLTKDQGKLTLILFDEMESFEHTKLKPVSIPLAVTKERHILVAGVARMPAKGLLAKKSRKKYGFRRDERPRVLKELFKTLVSYTEKNAHFKSDQNPHYPRLLFTYFPEATHETTPGLRGCVVGQGELKATRWDPLFSLNHTAAMFRANLNRLFRKTWCTTKTVRGLKDHLALYLHYHNTELL